MSFAPQAGQTFCPPHDEDETGERDRAHRGAGVEIDVGELPRRWHCATRLLERAASLQVALEVLWAGVVREGDHTEN
jgi:hypothetical protein